MAELREPATKRSRPFTHSSSTSATTRGSRLATPAARASAGGPGLRLGPRANERRSPEVASGGYFHFMRSVDLKTLRNKLSEYVRLAEGGETVLISDRDRVVAELVPPRETRSASLPDALLAEAVRHGHLTPAALPLGPPPRRPESRRWTRSSRSSPRTGPSVDLSRHLRRPRASGPHARRAPSRFDRVSPCPAAGDRARQLRRAHGLGGATSSDPPGASASLRRRSPARIAR